MDAQTRAMVLSAVHISEGIRSQGWVLVREVLDALMLRGDRIAELYVRQTISELLDRGKLEEVLFPDGQVAYKRANLN